MLVFSTLAEYQTTFWIDVANYLRSKGENVCFLSFDDRSSGLIRKAGYSEYNIPRLAKQIGEVTDPIQVFEKFDVHNIQNWITHERITFDINDTSILVDKFVKYLTVVDQIFKEIRENDEITVIQELGGFLSVISIFLISRHHKLDNWFLEPSFFRGMLFYNLNTFSSAKVLTSNDVRADRVGVQDYLNKTIESQSIMIPVKDKHQYNPALAKVLNIRNVFKLAQKLLRKYILKEHQEFGHIRRYVAIHVWQVINSVMLTKYYSNFDTSKLSERFVYFPLHVPGDAALTLRSPKYLDQIALIDFIARNVPLGTFLYIKEHPAQIGAIQRKQIAPILERFDNVRLISPSVNNFVIMNRASCIISINSKSGAEALAMGKKVIVLGDAFYQNSPLATNVSDLDNLASTLSQLLSQSEKNPQSSILSYFRSVWDRSSAGELYDSSPENIEIFGAELHASVKDTSMHRYNRE